MILTSDLRAAPLCLMCYQAPGTLWHRRYECPAWHVDRGQCTSQELRDAAAHFGARGGRAAELFSRGLLPHPDALLPAVKTSAACEICWVNRPSDGVLSGILFFDGSSRGGSCEALRRAGWAVVQVDRFGSLVSAAYGPVPWDQCPGQTSRDAEDCAVSMLPYVAMEPFELHIDCKGTLDTIGSPHSASAGARGPRANLWSRVWSSFDELRARKTKAHSSLTDVDRGLTTVWERQGNSHADRLAKEGVVMHGVTEAIELQYRSLASLAFQAARWAGEQAVKLRRAPADDAARLPEKGSSHGQPTSARLPRPKPSKRACLQGVLAASLRSNLARTSPSVFLGHCLRVSAAEPRGALLFCATCGAYAWASPRALLSQCLGAARTPGRAQQRARLAKHEFPSGPMRGTALGAPRPPAAEVIDALHERLARKRRAEPALDLEAEPGPATHSFTRDELLERYGLTEQSFAALVDKTWRIEQARKAGPREPADPEYFEWASDGSGSDSSV